MITPRTSMALVIGFCLPLGCATHTSPDVTPSRDVPMDPGIGERTTSTAGDTRGDEPRTTVCDGKPIERVEEYWPDGSPRFLQEVVIDEEGNEIPHGLTAQFWPNGQKKLELEYNCGVRDGQRVAWYEDGKLWSQGEFVNGKDHGHWIVWFSDETKSQEFTMVHGAWHGVHTVWGANGTKRMEVEWVDGKRQGPLKIWDADGNLFSADHYVDDIRQPTPLSHREGPG